MLEATGVRARPWGALTVRTDSRDDICKAAGHAPAAPGRHVPPLTLNIPGAQAIEVPGWFAGEFEVVLFNRGAWCPYCTAQLRAFQRAGDSLTRAGVRDHCQRPNVVRRRDRPAAAVRKSHYACRTRSGEAPLDP